MQAEVFDMVVVGSGPAGQQAAAQAARLGKRVLVIEKQREVGGECVHRGTIPSKTLRETTVALRRFPERTGGVFPLATPDHLQVASLMGRMHEVIRGHEAMIATQLEREGVTVWHGHASLADPHTLRVVRPGGQPERWARGRFIVLATGSRPRVPDNVPVDHEHILDSDSLLSMLYLPRSLAVLGGGVIACEYASIFAALGVQVTLIAREALPLRWMDPELSRRFVRAFEAMGGAFLGDRHIDAVSWDGVRVATTALRGGEQVHTEKVLCALGRVANLNRLQIDAAGLTTTRRGHLEVDAHCRTTAAPHIYAVGDVIGPPALAATSMEQGRRAARHAFGLDSPARFGIIPAGIYAVPEMSMIGLTEQEAIDAHGGVTVGRASFSEVARGLIANIPDGFLKIVADPSGRRLLGAHIIGEGATELIHLAQMALIQEADVDLFVEQTFNFPTLAEAYRAAALQIVAQRRARSTPERACA